ncbi:hypothetical protein BH24ACI4_BH24ACI4_23620 [soil metagenome]
MEMNSPSHVGLLDGQLRPAESITREQPVLEQLRLPLEACLGGFELQRLHLEAPVQVNERLLECQPCLRLLVLLDLQVLDHSLERQHRFADVELDDGIPRFKLAPGRWSSRRTRASSGLESTRSTSGATTPEAMITASTGPVTTGAVRIRERATVGRIHPGSHATSTATIRSGSAILSTRRRLSRR